MPLDAVCLSGVVKELREALTGLRIEKVQQPARDQVVLSFRGGKKLLLCAGARPVFISPMSSGRTPPRRPCSVCCCASTWGADG